MECLEDTWIHFVEKRGHPYHKLDAESTPKYRERPGSSRQAAKVSYQLDTKMVNAQQQSGVRLWHLETKRHEYDQLFHEFNIHAWLSDLGISQQRCPRKPKQEAEKLKSIGYLWKATIKDVDSAWLDELWTFETDDTIKEDSEMERYLGAVRTLLRLQS